MISRVERANVRMIFLFFLISVLTLLLAAGVARVSPKVAVALGVGLAIFIGSFASTEVALYVLIFSMLLSPEVAVGRTGGAAALGRGVTLRLDDFLLMLIGFSWFVRTAIYKELGLFLKTPLNRPILYYVLASVFSTGMGMIVGRVDLKTGFFFVLKYVEYFIVYFMAVNHITERKHVRHFLFALLGTCAIVSVVGIMQIPAGGRVTAPFEGEEGEPNTFGGYLVLMLSMVIGLFLTSESRRQKFALAALAFLIIMPFLETQSRGSYVATIPMFIALLVYSNKRLTLAATLIVLLVLGPFVVPRNVKERIVFTFKQRLQRGQVQLGTVRLDTSTSARLRAWKNVLTRGWIKHPLLGYGVTGYGFLDAQYPRVLAETGLLGFAAFIWLIYSLFTRAREAYRRARDPLFRGLALGFLAGLMAMLGHSVGANTFIIVRIMEPFWFLAAIVVMLPVIQESEAAKALGREIAEVA